MPTESAPVLALVRDLMFSSRIAAEARAQGATVLMIREPGKLGEISGSRLIVDLNLAGALGAASAWKQFAGKEVIGFVAHTDAQTIAAARAAGIDQVLPRSRFVEVLPDLLRST